MSQKIIQELNSIPHTIINTIKGIKVLYSSSGKAKWHIRTFLFTSRVPLTARPLWKRRTCISKGQKQGKEKKYQILSSTVNIGNKLYKQFFFFKKVIHVLVPHCEILADPPHKTSLEILSHQQISNDIENTTNQKTSLACIR